MHSLLLKLIRITVVCTLCLRYVYPASVCQCIRIKDCAPFVRLLLNHRPEERANVFAMVHDAGCGFQGLEPLACCPSGARNSHFMSSNERWVWDTSSGSKPKPVFNFNSFLDYEAEMQLHAYRDFDEQRNCPQPIDTDYDEVFSSRSGHHFQYNIEHAPNLKSKTTRPAPQDKPIVFPGDLRFQTVEINGRNELGAGAKEQSSAEALLTTAAKFTTTTSTPSTTPTSITPPMARMNSPDCGISWTTRLVGGEQALSGQYPWLARISYRNKSNNRISYRCSGSLISNNYIVTAAHCVVNLVSDLELFQVRIGDDASSSRDCAPSASNCTAPNLFDIGSILVHPNYDQPKYANDIALLSLNNLTGNFTPICLPLNSTEAIANRLVGQMGVAAGWSSTAAESSTGASTSVRFIRLPIVNTTSCAITYASISENFQQPIVITPSHLCAQGQPMNDVCRGDSGGPFMDDGISGLLNANGRYTLLGIVAFGPTLCGVTTIPGVYTAVSSFMNWISDSINSNI